MGIKELDPRKRIGRIHQEPPQPISRNLLSETQPLNPIDSPLFLARQDVTTALTWYRNTDTNRHLIPSLKTQDALYLADAYVSLKMDISALLTDIDDGIAACNEYDRLNFLSQKAKLLARSGAIEGAFSVAAQVALTWNTILTYHTYVDIAKSSKDRGIAQSAFDMAEEAIHEDGHMLCILAEERHAEGFEANDILKEARQTIDTQDGEKSYWFGPLAKAYATVGLFDEAMELIPRIQGSGPEDDRPHQLAVMRDIAYKQIAAGAVNEAIETAERTGDPYSKVAITVEAVRERAKQADVHATKMIEAALGMVKVLEGSMQRTDSHDYLAAYNSDLIARLYNTLAEATAYSGNDPQLLFNKALEIAIQGPEWSKFESTMTLVYVAEVQARVGIDAFPTFQQALLQADAIFNPLNADPFNWVSRVSAYEEIGISAINNQYSEIAEQVFERWDKDPDLESTGDKIKLLAHRAKARAASV